MGEGALEVLFCTITSKYRLHQCVAMYHSLKHCMNDAVLAVLAVDEGSKKALDALSLPEMLVLYAEELENDELKNLKGERNKSEYCWTLKPVLLLYLYENFEKIRILVYLDSDLFFFDNPMRLFEGKEKWSVLLTTHKVNRRANGGFAAFMRGSHANEALKWWKDRCLEWCYDKNDNGRFADQGYLDFMRFRFKGVSYLDMKGANVASWNYFRYDFRVMDGHIYVDNSRLIFYHFSGLRMKKSASSAVIYGAGMPSVLYGIYDKELKAAVKEIEEVSHEVTDCFYSGM